jgi:hypothetical protein
MREFARENNGIMGSNPTRVIVLCFPIEIVSSDVGSGLAVGWLQWKESFDVY